ncbi:alpha/beta fold hydrolase [Nioella aestuarii]|uniref:alpha/beta fold hydrolase n=1 Tax=Nioella aestuarii TaxID=1662864 RepID=UPI003D7FE8BA
MEPVVFIPGFMSDARVFRNQLETLSFHRSVQVASLDGVDSVREMATHVLNSLPERCALVGHSLGGMVAMELARRAPERVARLALIATDALSELPNVAATRDMMIARARAGRLDHAMAEAVPSAALAPGARRAAVIDTILDMAARAGVDRFQAQSRALQRRPDQQGTLRRLMVPTLVICGAHDRLFPPRRHEIMAGLLPQARMVLLEEAGHIPMLEQPEQMAECLNQWLAT